MTIEDSTVTGAIGDHFGSFWTFLYGFFGALIAAIVMMYFETRKNSGSHTSKVRI